MRFSAIDSSEKLPNGPVWLESWPYPYEPLDSHDILADVQPPAEWGKNSVEAIYPFPAPKTSPEPVVEAQGWSINQTGEVVLVAEVLHEQSQRGCRLR